MSSGLAAVYSVPLDQLRGLRGSRKRKLARKIATDFYREDVDEMFEEFDPPNTVYSALLQILDGVPLLEDRGCLYGYAVEGLCWMIGTTFYMPAGFPNDEYLEAFLKRCSSPVTLG